MPSDPRIALALAALAPRRAGFRAALAAARDQVLAHLAAHGGGGRDRVVELGAELGQFAGGRVDAARLASAIGRAPGLDPGTDRVVRRCADVLDELLDEGDALFRVEVPAGGDVRAAVTLALAEAGRAFGAVVAFRAATMGTYDAAHHEGGLHYFPFARWNRAERTIGVPLVVRVEGGDLSAESLAEFLDGRQQIVLVVEGPCPPAPLARLVSPGVLVLQAVDDLGPVGSFEGPTIAALVPEGAAELVSDPRAGADALVVRREATEPKAAAGRWSVAQQREQVAVLRALERTPGPAPRTKASADTPDSADAPERTGAPAVSAASASPCVGGAGPAAIRTDEALTASIAGWLLSEAGFATEAPT